MGLLDKVKDQAAVASAAAKEAAQKGQAKLDEMQAKREADALLRDLGATIYAERTGRHTTTTDVDQERIMAALRQHEAANGPISLVPQSPASNLP